MKKVIIIFLLALTISGCENSSKKSQDTNTTPTIQELLDEKAYTIIDVRTKEEYANGHIKGAINIPYDEIDENANLDKNNNIFVYCQSGKRSSIAYKKLTDLGYNVYDLGAFNEIDLPKE